MYQPTPSKLSETQIAAQLCELLHRVHESSETNKTAPFIDVDQLIDHVASSERLDYDERMWLGCRVRVVLRDLERQGLSLHWVAENWYLTELGVRQYREG